jgi:hypothetical protein
VQPAFEEVVRTFDDDQLLRFRQRGGKCLQLCSRTELVAGSADEQLGFRTIVQKFERVYARIFGLGGYRSNRNSQPITALTRGSAQAGRRPMAAPNENPAKISGT